MCPACRAAALKAVAAQRSRALPDSTDGGADDRKKPLCFACYRADLDRLRALKAAGQLDTGSEARFQFQLPFEPVDHLRLATLRSDREFARRESRRTTAGPSVDRRRQAQIAARHVLSQIAVGFAARTAARAQEPRAMRAQEPRAMRAQEPCAMRAQEPCAERAEEHSVMGDVFEAVELQLPEAWIPFVMSRSGVR